MASPFSPKMTVATDAYKRPVLDHFRFQHAPFSAAYLIIAVAVTSLFLRYLLIVVLVIYSLLKMAEEVVQNRQFIPASAYLFIPAGCVTNDPSSL